MLYKPRKEEQAYITKAKKELIALQRERLKQDIKK